MAPDPTTCPACGAGSWAPALERDGYAYVGCERCGLVRLDPLPSPEAAVALYDEGYFTESSSGGYHDYVGDEAIHRRNATRHLAAVATAVPARGRLLEVGAAAGFLLDEARRDGWSTADGVEVAPVARHARERLGLRVVETIDDAGGAADPYDACVMNQVLEHLVDPLAALRSVHRSLRPEGHLRIETWDRASLVGRVLGARWQQVTPPSVLWLFRGEDLEAVLGAAGFVDVVRRRATKWVSVRTVLGQTAGARPAVRRVADGRLGAVGIPYRLGDLVVVSARRPGP